MLSYRCTFHNAWPTKTTLPGNFKADWHALPILLHLQTSCIANSRYIHATLVF
ncbi:hypothetical protein BT96DRAFT_927391 [Gymnopus androsaceus JB14]|uniref:Uncharacterized protein n=1 Tax=Gymnopus androsaceus JB14 TaxID=1447944 RepID=A0A6A4GQB4_9AGAR|nr:hypothetical protein BT96DRAFT_927391 [Gymnopus androsaceus JB14]